MNKRFAQFLVLGIHFTLDIRGGAKRFSEPSRTCLSKIISGA